MRLATVDQSKNIDHLSQTVYQIPDQVLMEAAGAVASKEIDQNFFLELQKGQTSVVCGPGNNGGDGLVVARHLRSNGYRQIVVYTMAKPQMASSLFQVQLNRTSLSGIKIVNLVDEPERLDEILTSSLIVDAIFGIGLNRPVEGEFLRLIDTVNSSKAPVISLDNPSGLDCDRGIVLGRAVEAEMTVTFGLAKPGFFVSEGPGCVGRLRVCSIGFPYEGLRRVATTCFGFNEKLCRRSLPPINDLAHKASNGHLVVFAGNTGTWGAAALAASSASRMGAGYVTLASTGIIPEAIKEFPEFLTAEIEDEKIWDIQKISAVAVGPGLGVNEKTASIIEKLKRMQFKSVVLDADAITVCAKENLWPLPPSWVITPHSGELSRVLKNVSSEEINSDRFRFASEGAKKAGCHVLLKGFRSVLAHGNRVMVILSGNSALAKAGTGDVLTGMIGGLLAQNLSPIRSTATAAYIHGRIADEWVRAGKDKQTLCTSDVRDQLPSFMSQMRDGAFVTGIM